MLPEVTHAYSAGVSEIHQQRFQPVDPTNWSLHQHTQSRQIDLAAPCLFEVFNDI